MKIGILTSLLILVSTCFSFSEDVPREVARLEEQRIEAIRKIDQIYIKKLEKIKLNLTKAANLEAAVAVDARIKRLQKQLGAGADVYFSGNGISEISIVGEYDYTYLSNGYRETWVFKSGGEVEFRPVAKSRLQGEWKLSDNVLIVKRPGRVNLVYHFPVDSLVSSKIEGDQRTAMIQKK